GCAVCAGWALWPFRAGCAGWALWPFGPGGALRSFGSGCAVCALWPFGPGGAYGPFGAGLASRALWSLGSLGPFGAGDSRTFDGGVVAGDVDHDVGLSGGVVHVEAALVGQLDRDLVRVGARSGVDVHRRRVAG